MSLILLRRRPAPVMHVITDRVTLRGTNLMPRGGPDHPAPLIARLSAFRSNFGSFYAPCRLISTEKNHVPPWPARRRRHHPDGIAPHAPALPRGALREPTGQEGATWEWITAPNGPQADPGLIAPAIAKDARVTVVTRPGPGPAPARNTALNYVRAPHVAFADDDDRLPSQSLAVRNEHAISTGLHWVAGRSADWDAETGTRTTWMCPTPVGRHAAGDILKFWPDPMASKPPLGHCMLLTDTRLARAVGHGGLHKGEDYRFAVGVPARRDGLMLGDVVYERRVHDHQWSSEASYRGQVEFDARRHAWLIGHAERALRAERAAAGSAAA
ncbi:glycosyltransferase [Streptomyces sp. P1-3]|uniref:glycosyltransferase n=1 Tax=Streptomyces sp. P1-3 TaxID=3421658 RepID=UPI003D35F44A